MSEEKFDLGQLAQGRRIAYLRRLRGMTQWELGVKAGFPKSSAGVRIAQYEGGNRSPKWENLCMISEALQVSADMVKRYDFRERSDILFIMLWLDFITPLEITESMEKLFSEAGFPDYCDHWKSAREDLVAGEISPLIYRENKLRLSDFGRKYYGTEYDKGLEDEWNQQGM